MVDVKLHGGAMDPRANWTQDLRRGIKEDEKKNTYQIIRKVCNEVTFVREKIGFEENVFL